MARGDSMFVVNSEGMMRFTDAAMAASIQTFSVSKLGIPTALQEQGYEFARVAQMMDVKTHLITTSCPSKI